MSFIIFIHEQFVLNHIIHFMLAIKVLLTIIIYPILFKVK